MNFVRAKWKTENAMEGPTYHKLVGNGPRDNLDNIDKARTNEILKAISRVSGIASSEVDAWKIRSIQVIRVRVVPTKKKAHKDITSDVLYVLRGFTVRPDFFGDKNGTLKPDDWSRLP